MTVEELRAALAIAREPRFPASSVEGARPAAVVLALELQPLRLLVVQRATTLADHAGELAFPGGKPESADVDLRATAARELEEECGVAPAGLDWLGQLLPCPVITGRFLIHPFVAALPAGAAPRAASGEVARVLWLELEPLLAGSQRYGAVRGSWRGVDLLTPHFMVGSALMYGASAAIAHDLLWRIAAQRGQPLPEPELTHDAVWGDRYKI